VPPLPAQHRPAPIAALLAGALLLGSVLGSVPAGAHGTSRSYSTWVVEESGATVSVRIALVELTRLGRDPLAPDAGRWLGDYLARHLELERAGSPCRPVAAPVRQRAREGWTAFRWRVECPPASGPYRIRSRLLLREAPGHLHFARAEGHGVDGIVERVLTEAEPAWTPGPVDAAAPAHPGTSFPAYLVLGIEHILTGWDHLAFLLAFLLLAHSAGEVVRLVTGFTVAHSLTLALAVLDWVEPEVAAVEAVIGFSVALVAAENGWLLAGRARMIPWLTCAGLAVVVALSLSGHSLLPPLTGAGLLIFAAAHFAWLDRSRRPERIRTALAFAFGLVHGFGFAGVLSELQLPVERLVPALLGFNLGVEAGQLGVVVLVWPLLRALERSAGGWHRRLAELGSAAIVGLGLFWFVERSFG